MGVKWTEVCTTDRFGKSAEHVHSSSPKGNKVSIAIEEYGLKETLVRFG